MQFDIPLFTMSEFDINRELEIIKINENLFTIKISNDFYLEYFYFVHRLGTRVPLILILNPPESEESEILNYFCKIGNVLSFNLEKLKINNDFNLLSITLVKLFRQFGTNFGVIIYFECSDIKLKYYLIESLNNSSFLKSEISAFVGVGLEFEENEATDFQFKRMKILQINFPKMIHYDLLNALILEKLQNELKAPSLDWNWQYEQSDKLFLFSKLVLKNLTKWKKIDSIGTRVGGTKIIPMKLMRDDDEDHSPEHVLHLHPKIGLIIDLSNDEGSYDKEIFLTKGIQYNRIQIESKVIPSSNDIFEFIRIVKNFTEKCPDSEIIVHCHYGYNRTGMMICAYLIEVEHLTVQEALEVFKRARPPGIKHQNYIDKLLIRYSEF